MHSASVNSAELPHGSSAVNTFMVSPHFGSPPAAELLRQQFILALEGELDVIAALQKRDRETARYGSGTPVSPRPPCPRPHRAPPRVLWHPPAQTGEQQLVEIRAADRAGLLAVLTGIFERAGVDISGPGSPPVGHR